MEIKHKGKNSYPERTKARVNTSYDSLTSNDIAYYNKHPEDLRNAARVQWAEYMGVPFAFDKVTSKYTPKQPIAGIITTDVLVGPGGCGVATDAVNRAFHMMMSDMYARTSASQLQFDQGTLATFYASTCSISDLIAYAKRALKTVTFWISRNINYPRALVQAMGINYDDLVQHKADYMIQLNELIAKFNTFGILQCFDVYGREYSMFKNIYIDEDSDLAQIYIYKPLNYYKYSDTDSKAIYYEAPWANTKMTGVSFTGVLFSRVLEIIDELIEAWRTSQDFFYVTGTINRAYPSEARMVIDGIMETDTIDPIVDDVMMLQLMNATYVRGTYMLENSQSDQRAIFQDSVDITHDPVTGVISWGPKVRRQDLDPLIAQYLTSSGRMLRMFSDSPTEDDITEMTRLVVIGEVTGSGDNRWIEFPNCSPELIAGSLILTFDMSSNTCLNNSGAYKYAWIASNVMSTCPYYDSDDIQAPSTYSLMYNGSWRRCDADWNITLTNDIYTLFKIQPFRYVPLIILVDRKQGTNSVTTDGVNPETDVAGFITASEENPGTQVMPIGDLYNYTQLSDNQYLSLQRVCLRSLYEPTFLK